MRLIPIQIEARSPLAFPERKPGVQFRSSLPYVPGAAIYGALGALLSQVWEGTAEEFAALFRGIRCHNAYPALAGDPWVRPLPMTALEPKKSDQEKRAEKRITKDAGRPYRPYLDSLYGRVCWEQQRPMALIFMPTDAEGRAYEAVERSTFYTLEDAAGKPWDRGSLDGVGIGKRQVTQRVLTRVSINRRRGVAEDARLYSPLVINEVTEGRDKELTNTSFLGSIVVPDDDRHVMAALKRITLVGGRQTTGIGAVRIDVRQTDPVLEENADTLRRRIEVMTDRFEKQATLHQQLGGGRWRDAQGNERETPGMIFTVNLLSDAILFDRGWLPTNELNGKMLAEFTRTFTDTGEIDYPGITARLLRSFTTTTIVGGWNVSWQRPKPTAIATTMGSVFVFGAEREFQSQDYEALARLERDGIGERRPEGYGEIRICDEFHLLPSLEEA